VRRPRAKGCDTGRIQIQPNIIWKPLPKQAIALARTENEVLYGGARGGAKSDCGIAWLVKHRTIQRFNPETGMIEIEPQEPRILRDLRGLVIRANEKDLAEWISRARVLYEPTGAKFAERPLQIRWPDGHIIRGGHLKDSKSYELYKSQQYQQVLVEELTQVPDLDLFKRLLGCCRSTMPEIKAQFFATTNPDGPGSAWVNARYVKVLDKDGNLIPSMTTMLDAATKRTRIFIPAFLKDNPYLMHNEDYLNQLKDQPEATRRAWLEGDWDSMLGPYFKWYRPHGPLAGEPPEARHVILGADLLPWWPRTMGVDWGYDHFSSVHWGCQNKADGRLHIYREFVIKGMGSEVLGSEIAKMSMSDLEGLPDHTIPLHLDPSCFSKTDAKYTFAEQIRRGIEIVLGAGSAFLVDLTDDEQRLGSPEKAWQSMEQRYNALDGRMRIIIYRANNRRADGWQYLHGLMRFTPIEPEVQPDMDFARELFLSEGRDAYQQYLARHKKPREVLPKIQIWDCCQKLKELLAIATHDDDGKHDIRKFVGDDPLQSARYLVMGDRSRENQKPLDIQIAERIAAAGVVNAEVLSDPMVRHQVVQKTLLDQEKNRPLPWGRFARGSMRNRRRWDHPA